MPDEFGGIEFDEEQKDEFGGVAVQEPPPVAAAAPALRPVPPGAIEANINPYERARQTVGGPIGPFGPPNPQEILAIPGAVKEAYQAIAPFTTGELAKAPMRLIRPALEAAHEALAPAVSDFLVRSGIDPSSTPDKVINLPRTAAEAVPRLPGLPPPAALAGGANVAAATAEALAQPEQALLIFTTGGGGLVARAAGIIFAAEQFQALPAEIQNAIRVVADPNASAQEKVEAVGQPGVNTLLGVTMARAGMRPVGGPPGGGGMETSGGVLPSGLAEFPPLPLTGGEMIGRPRGARPPEIIAPPIERVTPEQAAAQAAAMTRRVGAGVTLPPLPRAAVPVGPAAPPEVVAPPVPAPEPAAFEDFAAELSKRGKGTETIAEIQAMFPAQRMNREAARRLAKAAFGDQWQPAGKPPGEAPPAVAPHEELDTLLAKQPFASTEQAFEIGLKAKTLADLEGLLQQRIEAGDKFKELLKQADAEPDMDKRVAIMNSATPFAHKAQLANEAIQAATRSVEGIGKTLPGKRPLDFTEHPDVRAWLIKNADRLASGSNIDVLLKKLGAERPDAPEPAAAAPTAPLAPTDIGARVIAGKMLAEWEAVKDASGLPRGAERAELAKFLAVPNQPGRILAALANPKRTRDIHAPPFIPPEEPPAAAPVPVPKPPPAPAAPAAAAAVPAPPPAPGELLAVPPSARPSADVQRNGIVRLLEQLEDVDKEGGVSEREVPEEEWETLSKAAADTLGKDWGEVLELDQTGVIKALRERLAKIEAFKSGRALEPAPIRVIEQAANPSLARIRRAYQKWDDGIGGDTERNLLDQVENEISDFPDRIPPELQAAAEKYREALEEDYEAAGRGDVEPSQEAFMAELEKLSGRPPEAGAAPAVAATPKEVDLETVLRTPGGSYGPIERLRNAAIDALGLRNLARGSNFSQKNDEAIRAKMLEIARQNPRFADLFQEHEGRWWHKATRKPIAGPREASLKGYETGEPIPEGSPQPPPTAPAAPAAATPPQAPKPNSFGTYNEKDAETLENEPRNYKKPHATIRVLQLGQDKWIASKSFQTSAGSMTGSSTPLSATTTYPTRADAIANQIVDLKADLLELIERQDSVPAQVKQAQKLIAWLNEVQKKELAGHEEEIRKAVVRRQIKTIDFHLGYMTKPDSAYTPASIAAMKQRKADLQKELKAPAAPTETAEKPTEVPPQLEGPIRPPPHENIILPKPVNVQGELYTFTPEEVKKANMACRVCGAVGAGAITPKYVLSTSEPLQTILDFGAGDQAPHTKTLREQGRNVTAYEFGQNVVAGIHDVNALDRKYHTVFASNVLNVQSGLPMLRATLKEIFDATETRAVFNYPRKPRYSDLSTAQVAAEIENIFGVKPERVGGTLDAPIWEVRLKGKAAAAAPGAPEWAKKMEFQPEPGAVKELGWDRIPDVAEAEKEIKNRWANAQDMLDLANRKDTAEGNKKKLREGAGNLMQLARSQLNELESIFGPEAAEKIRLRSMPMRGHPGEATPVPKEPLPKVEQITPKQYTAKDALDPLLTQAGYTKSMGGRMEGVEYVTPKMTKAALAKFEKLADELGWEQTAYNEPTPGKGREGYFRRKPTEAERDLAHKKALQSRLQAVAELDPSQAEAARAEIAKLQAEIDAAESKPPAAAPAPASPEPPAEKMGGDFSKEEEAELTRAWATTREEDLSPLHKAMFRVKRARSAFAAAGKWANLKTAQERARWQMAKAEVAASWADYSRLKEGRPTPAAAPSPEPNSVERIAADPQIDDLVQHPDFGRVMVTQVGPDTVRFQIQEGAKTRQYASLSRKEWAEDLTGKLQPPAPAGPKQYSDYGGDAFDVDRLAKLLGMSQNQWQEQPPRIRNSQMAGYLADKPSLLELEDAIDAKDYKTVSNLFRNSVPPDHNLRKLFSAITKTRIPEEWAEKIGLKKAPAAPPPTATPIAQPSITDSPAVAALRANVTKIEADRDAKGEAIKANIEREVNTADPTERKELHAEGMKMTRELEALQDTLSKAKSALIDQRIEESFAPFRGRKEPEPSEPTVTAKELKGQKESLLEQVDQALKAAPESGTKKVKFSVPGDGEWAIENNQEKLKAFRALVAKEFPTTVEASKAKIGGTKASATKSGAMPTAPKVAEPKDADLAKIVAPATSGDPARFILQYIYSDGTQMVATDGRQLVRVVTDKAPGTIAEPQLLNTEGKRTDETGTFPNYNVVFPTDPSLVLGGLPTDKLWHLAHKAKTFRDSFDLDEPPGMDLYVNPDRSLGASWEHAEESFTDNVQDVAFWAGTFNPDYLLDAMNLARRLGNDLVDFYLSGTEGPAEFVGKNHQHLVQGMRGAKSGDSGPIRDDPARIERGVSGMAAHRILPQGLGPLANPEAFNARTVGEAGNIYRVSYEAGEFKFEKLMKATGPYAQIGRDHWDVLGRLKREEATPAAIAETVEKGLEAKPAAAHLKQIREAVAALNRDRENVLEEARKRAATLPKGPKLPPGISMGPGAAARAEFEEAPPSTAALGIEPGNPLYNRAVARLKNFYRGMGQLFTRRGRKQDISQLVNASRNIPRVVGQLAGNSLRLRADAPERRAITFVMQALKMSGDGLSQDATARMGELEFQGDPLGYLRTKQADMETKAQEFLNNNQRLEAQAAVDAARAMELAQRKYNQLLPIARRARRQFDAQMERERFAHIDTNYERWYVPQRHDLDLFASADSPIILGHSKGTGTAAGFRKAKVFEDYATAIENGFVPRSLDIADLMEHRVFQGERLIQRKALFNKLRRVMDPVDDKALVIDIPRRVINRPDGSFDIEESVPRGYTAHEIMPGVKVAVHDGYARLIRALTGSSQISESAAVGTLQDIAAIEKHIALALDTFHASRTMQAELALTGKISVGAHQKRGLALVEYKTADLDLAVSKGLITQEMADWVRTPETVTVNGREVQLSPHNIMVLGLNNGLNMARIADVMYRDWLREVPITGTVNKWVFDKMTRSAIAQAFDVEFRRVAKNNPNLGAARVARAVARDINVMFGNLQAESIFKNPSLGAINQILFLAPRWVEAMATREVRAVSQTARMGVELMSGRPVHPETVAKGIGTGLAAYFVATQVLNLATRGHLTFGNQEKGHKLDAWIPDVTGKTKGFFISPLSVFGEVTHDIIRYAEDKPDLATALQQIGANKLGNLGRFLEVVALGRDPMTGQKIIGTGRRAVQAAVQVIPVPISLSQVTRAAGTAVAPGLFQAPTPGSVQRQITASLGFKTEPAGSAQSQIRNIATHWALGSPSAVIRGAVERRLREDFGPSDYGPLRSALVRGDAEDASRAYEKLLETKNPQVIRQTMAHPHPFTGSARTERLFLQTLTPAQRKTYYDAVRERKELNRKFEEMLRQRYQRK